MILIDMGAKYSGYCSDMTRSFCIGDVGEQLSKIHQIVLDAQEYAISCIKAGMSCLEIDSMAREYIKANGYGEQFVHSLGHGVGVFIHEQPRMSQTSKEVLKENMVITVEPGIYVNGLGGVRIEDMLVVQEGGARNLTNYDKSLYIK
jgi:Xaa-Pro aminopeptidase